MGVSGAFMPGTPNLACEYVTISHICDQPIPKGPTMIQRRIALLLALVLALMGSPVRALADDPQPLAAPEAYGPPNPQEHPVATGYEQETTPARSIHDANESAETQPLYAGEIPSSYSSVAKGYVTPVRDQDPFGTCWAFGVTAAVESSLLAHGQVASASSLDLSERHLAYFTYHTAPDPLGNTAGDSVIARDETWLNNGYEDGYLETGGNALSTTHTLESWAGLVNEDAVPTYEQLVSSYYDCYDYDYGFDWSRGGQFLEETALDPSTSHALDSWHLTNMRRIKMEDVDDVKAAVMECGAVTVSLNFNYAYFNWETCAHYNYVDDGTNHLVVIVGWDDDYSASNFVPGEYADEQTAPEHDGAWLCKNSWDEWWGDEGYFWLSYDELTLHQEWSSAYAFYAEPASAKDNIYQYDGTPGTCLNYVESGGSIANVYQARANAGGAEQLTAVALSLPDVNVDYSVQVYTDLDDPSDPESGIAALASPVTGKTSYEGYYTVDLPKPVMITEGSSFSVVVTLSHGDGDDVSYNIDSTYGFDDRYAENNRWKHFSSHVEPNQSFERDYEGAPWDDLSSEDYDARDDPECCARLKAFTNNVAETRTNIGSALVYTHSVTYTGSPQEPAFQVYVDGNVLTLGTDYTLSYSDNVNAGVATVTVKGIGNYYGRCVAPFNVLPESVARTTIAAIHDQQETGSALKPKLDIRLGSYALVEGVDYTVSYADNVNAGTATVTVTGMGNFMGTTSTTFKITAPDIQLIPIYRMYNTKTSEHLWTKSKAEYNACGTGNYKDWRQENVAWYSPNLKAPASYAASMQGDYVYVYRLYDKGRTGDHIYLTYGAEMKSYLSNGWVVDKGAGFWTMKKGATISDRTMIPIYRAYNPKLKRGKHHYTPSKSEYDTICKKHGWKPEGVKFYVIKK